MGKDKIIGTYPRRKLKRSGLANKKWNLTTSMWGLWLWEKLNFYHATMTLGSTKMGGSCRLLGKGLGD